MRAVYFAVAVAMAMLAFWAGMLVEELHCQANAPVVFTKGFENGVQCGVIAFTYDPTETDIPTITTRARYWYVAMHGIRKEKEQHER
jgi:hypothetical protein